MPLSCKWNYRVKKRLFQNRGPEGALREKGAGNGDVTGQAEDGLGQIQGTGREARTRSGPVSAMASGYFCPKV